RAGPALILRQLDLHAGNAGAGEGIRIGPAPQLAVGHDVEPDLLLQRDHAADGIVLDRAQLVAAELALCVLRSRLQKPRRGPQGADMLRAEGGRSLHPVSLAWEVHRPRWAITKLPTGAKSAHLAPSPTPSVGSAGIPFS